jgi:CubicO group peptidase (beta-lactamase class C family)
LKNDNFPFQNMNVSVKNMNMLIMSRFFQLSTLLFLSLLAVALPAQNVDHESIQKIDEIFERFDSDTVPGCAVSVFRDGESIFKKGYGISNLDYGIEISDSTSFYMASVSKHVTAAAAGLLIIRGEIEDDAYVRDYLENWPEYAADVTVHQLFNHTSGLPDIYGLIRMGGRDVNDVMDLEDYLEVVSYGEELMFEPGSEYSYTNAGYTTLALLVQEVSGMSFPEFTDKEFFKPFGMSATHFHDDRTRIVPNRAISYQPGGEQFRRTYPGNFQGVGPGGLYSTLNDWERWEQFWSGDLSWDGGISETEAAELKSWMLAATYAGGEMIPYRRGIRVEQIKGQENVNHGGSFSGFRTHYSRFPEHGYSFM